MYSCNIVADSISNNSRLTTFVVTYPRIIHSEMMTHRVFSRNSASSRAIPLHKTIEEVKSNPFIPIAWQKPHKGMQGVEYNEYPYTEYYRSEWLKCRDAVINQLDVLGANVTKQLCNRLLEPFMWHKVIITATDWDNFFELRCPKILNQADGKYYRSLKDWNNVDKEIQWLGISCLHPENKSQADIHIQAIAELMWDAYNESTPKQLKAGEWHIPFGDKMDDEKVCVHADAINIRPKIATARCARISYQTFGDNPKIDYEADIRLHDRLLEEQHMSPFEHCAVNMNDTEYYNNFKGWRSYRKKLEK